MAGFGWFDDGKTKEYVPLLGRERYFEVSNDLFGFIFR